MAKAYVNGVGWIEKQTKTLDITKDGSYNITPDQGKMLSGVTVNVDTPGSKVATSFYADITENGEYGYVPGEGIVYNHIHLNVNVPQGEGGGIAGLDDRLDDIIGLQESYIGGEPSEGLEMSLNACWHANGYAVTGIGTCTDAEIVIPNNPSEYDLTPIACILDNAFRENTNITKVVFGRNIVHISLMAFWGCSNCKVYDFSKVTAIPWLDVTSFGGSSEDDPFWVAYTFGNPEDLPEGTQFLVPASLYDAWIEETNWCVYADYIYPASASPTTTSPTTTVERLDTIEGNVEKVHNAGQEKGKQAEYDAFWDAFQSNGNRTDYNTAFSGFYWNADTLRPKYPIKIVDYSSAAFSNCFFKSGLPSTEHNNLLDISHIKIDVSKATACDQMFANARVNGVTLIFSEKITNLNQAFTKANGGSIGGMEITLLVPNPNCNWTNTFQYHRVKRLILLDGTVIGKNGFNVSWANGLPHDDLVGIVNALSNETSGLSVSLNKQAVNKAFETSSGANDGSTSAEWLALIATKPNWTISLV